MSRNKKIHDLIDGQNPEKKKAFWNRLKNGLEQDTVKNTDSRKKNLIRRRIIAISGSLVLIGGIFGIGIYAWLWNTPTEEKPEDRFCTSEEYVYELTDKTLKEYGESIGVEFLYFNWYANNEFLMDYTYTLKDSKEIICFREEIVNSETGLFVALHVTDNKTELDAFDLYKVHCSNEQIIQGVTVLWGWGDIGYMNWEYEGYRYYLEVEAPENSDVLFSLAEELLS